MHTRSVKCPLLAQSFAFDPKRTFNLRGPIRFWRPCRPISANGAALIAAPSNGVYWFDPKRIKQIDIGPQSNSTSWLGYQIILYRGGQNGWTRRNRHQQYR